MSACSLFIHRLSPLNWHSGLRFWHMVQVKSHTIFGAITKEQIVWVTVYPKKYAHGFCFAVLCCDYTLTDFPISIRLTSLALWQSNDCPRASKATLMNMDKYFMWIHYERLHNHNKAKHNKTVCIFLGIYCIWMAHKMSISCQKIKCCLLANIFQRTSNLTSHIQWGIWWVSVMSYTIKRAPFDYRRL